MSAYLVPQEFRYSDGTPYTQFQVVIDKPRTGVLETLRKIREVCRGTLAEKILAQQVYDRMHASISASSISGSIYLAQQCNPYSNPYLIEQIYNLILNEEVATPSFRTFEEARKWFQMAVDPTLLDFVKPTKESIFARGIGSNRIINSIYLGCDRGFLETTGLEYREGYVNIRTTNPNQFKTIISLCPIDTALERFFPGEKILDLSLHYESQKINWFKIGENVPDKKHWLALVHNCTLPQSELTQKHGNPDDFIAEKQTVMQNIPIDQWFEPIFQVLDRGFRNEERVFIHCQAGISRSATVVIAYFAKRLGLTPTQVQEALRNYRLCMNSAFMPDIMEYYNRLRSERRELSPTQ